MDQSKYHVSSLVVHVLLWASILYQSNVSSASSVALYVLSYFMICLLTVAAVGTLFVNINDIKSKHLETISLPTSFIFNISTYGIAVALVVLGWWFNATIFFLAAVTGTIIRYNYHEKSVLKNKQSNNNTTL